MEQMANSTPVMLPSQVCPGLANWVKICASVNLAATVTTESPYPQSLEITRLQATLAKRQANAYLAPRRSGHASRAFPSTCFLGRSGDITFVTRRQGEKKKSGGGVLPVPVVARCFCAIRSSATFVLFFPGHICYHGTLQWYLPWSVFLAVLQGQKKKNFNLCASFPHKHFVLSLSVVRTFFC